MRRTRGFLGIVILSGLLAMTSGEPLAAVRSHTQRAPGASYYSPQVSPDGHHVLWESLERGGSIWLTDEDGEDLEFLVQGHSPSWNGSGRFRFVVSHDDGHELKWQDLYEYDIISANIKMVAVNSGNPEYSTTLTGDWTGSVEGELSGGALAGKTICVDPGHGANSGATSTISGKKEDHYVLIMSYLARDYLEAAGANVRMTRFDNSILPGLQERVNFSNSIGAASFNAVHLNSSKNASARGLELYYRTKVTQSQAQARKIHDAMVAATGIPTRGVRPDKETLGHTLAVLSETHKMNNKTLSEACFLTNAEDVAMLERTRCLDQWAWGIYAGTARQLGVEPTPIAAAAVESTIESFSGGVRRPWIGGVPVPTAMETPEGDGSAAVVRNATHPFTALRQGGATWADYKVTATATVVEGKPVYGLIARSNKCAREGDLLEGYLLVVDEASRTAHLKLSLGKPSEAVTLVSAPIQDSPRGWRALALECRGTKLIATVDGAALEWAPADPAAVQLHEGKAGVLVLGEGTTRVAVDRFAIEP